MNAIQDKINNSVFQNSNAIQFNPSSEVMDYGVEINIGISEEEVIAINYTVSVCWEFKNRQGEYLVAVKFKNFLVNQNKPELLMEILADRCRQPINDIKFLLSNEGKITDILNYEAILQKWQEVKEELRKEYSGKIFERYLSLQEKIISNKDFLLEKLSKDIFLSQFFSGIYNHNFRNYFIRNYENPEFMNISYEIPVTIEMLNEGIYSNKKELFLRKAIDEKSYNFNQMPIENYKTFYTLDGNHFIKSVMGKFEALHQSVSFAFNFKER